MRASMCKGVSRRIIKHRGRVGILVSRQQMPSLNPRQSLTVVTIANHCVTSFTQRHRGLRMTTPYIVAIAHVTYVIKRERQLMMVVREYVPSYATACMIENERRETQRDALMTLCVRLISFDGSTTVIRTDSAPGFASLVNDELLSRYGITID